MSNPSGSAGSLFGIAIHRPSYRLAAGRKTGLSGVDFTAEVRSIAASDEDTLTMAVGAARLLSKSQDPAGIVAFSSSRMPYERRTNAPFLRAAGGLGGPSVMCIDLTGGETAAMAAIVEGSRHGGVVVLSDMVVGQPGSLTEATGGDGAVALDFRRGDTEPAATILRHAITSDTDLHRWRVPGEAFDRTARGRYSNSRHEGAAVDVGQTVLGDLGASRVAFVGVSSADRRLAERIAASFTADTVMLDGIRPLGYMGMANIGLLIDGALRSTEPGDIALVITVGDGVGALAMERGTGELPSVMDSPYREVPYPEYLAWRGLLAKDMTARPEVAAPSIPAMGRDAAWKYSLVGSRCTNCGNVQLPPSRVCGSCHSIDKMADHDISRKFGTIATLAEDHLAVGLQSPVVSAVVDFDGGGRLECQIADADVSEVAVGQRVGMCLRRSPSSDGIHNYVWKGTSMRERES